MVWRLCTLHVRAEGYIGTGDEHTVCGKHPHTRINDHYCSYSFNNIIPILQTWVKINTICSGISSVSLRAVADKLKWLQYSRVVASSPVGYTWSRVCCFSCHASGNCPFSRCIRTGCVFVPQSILAHCSAFQSRTPMNYMLFLKVGFIPPQFSCLKVRHRRCQSLRVLSQLLQRDEEFQTLQDNWAPHCANCTPNT